MKRIITILAASGLILSTSSCTQPPTGDVESENRPAVRARTQVLGLTTVTDHFQSPGTITARIHTVLSSKVVGQVTSVHVREGDRVHKDQLLIEIEGRDAAAQLRRAQAGEAEARQALEEVNGAIRAADAALRAAEADRDLALATRKRYEVLRDRHSVSPQEFDEIDARYKAAVSGVDRAQETIASAQARRSQVLSRIEQAKAEVELARVALGYLKITSPINGVVTARKADPGVLATPGIPLLALDDDSTYQLESVVEDSHVAAMRVGQRASVEIDAIGAEMGAQVRQIVPSSDPATRTYTVKLDLDLTPEIQRGLRSGFFGRASFPNGERQVLVVPESALIHQGQLTGVYVVQNGTALLRLVKTGKRYEQGIEVLSGLSAGTRIVTEPVAQVFDGATIIDQPPKGIE